MKYHFLSAALIVVAVVMELSGIAHAHSGLGATMFTGGVACELWLGIRMISRLRGAIDRLKSARGPLGATESP